MMRIVVACLVVMLGIHYALAQNAARHWITTSSSNSTVAFAAKAILDSVIVSNPNAASPGYLKLYNRPPSRSAVPTPRCGRFRCTPVGCRR
jgi:hypothetical protein